MDSFPAAVVIGLFLLVILARKYAWPFTTYPMFSVYRRAEELCVICLALESSDGTLRPWRPHFYRYTDGIAGRLANSDANGVSSWMDQVTRLLALEHGDISWCTAIHVLERRWVSEAPSDRTLYVFPVKGHFCANRS